jgi:hypothetical protein
MDVEYASDRKYGWVPSPWVYTILNEKGAIQESYNATVTDWAVNVPIDPDRFEITFPPGTRVVEPRNSPTPNYIGREDGSKRIIPPEDIGATYEQLIRTQPGTALEEMEGSKGWLLFVLAVGTLIVILGTGIAWKRLRRRSA